MIYSLLAAARIPHLVDARVAPRNGQFHPAGILLHHTGGPSSGDLPTLKVLQNGRSDLPGPLCQIGVGRYGTVAVVTDGRANHAGKGNAEALHRVMKEEPPAARPGPDDTDGNAWFIGIEIENQGNGTDPYPPNQANAVVATCLAICRDRGWGPNRIIGHKQWTRRKNDPSRSFDELVRTRVHNELNGEPDMPLNDDDKKFITDTVYNIVTERLEDAAKKHPPTNTGNAPTPKWTIEVKEA